MSTPGNGRRPHIIMLTYYFPPQGMGGVQRPLKFARYLPEYGWDVTVLTPDLGAYHARDASLVAELPPAVRVERIPWREPGHRLRVRFRARTASGSSGFSPPPWTRRLQQYARWPDDKFGFVRHAVGAARRLLRQRPADIIWTTSPPPSLHRAGLMLSNSCGVKWIADFRDPWLLRKDDWGPTPLHARYAKQLRRRIVRQADAVVAVNDTMAGMLARDSGSADIRVIHNGYDELDFIPVATAPNTAAPFTIMFYGTLAPVTDPEPAFRMIARWRERGSAPAFRILHVGAVVGLDLLRLARRCAVDDLLITRGYLAHADAVASLVDADLVVVPITRQAGFEATVPGRVFEVLRSLRPILLIAPADNATTRLLKDIDGAWCVSPDDTEGGIAVLNAVSQLPPRQPVRDLTTITRFDRREQTHRLAALMNTLMRREGRNRI